MIYFFSSKILVLSKSVACLDVAMNLDMAYESVLLKQRYLSALLTRRDIIIIIIIIIIIKRKEKACKP